MSDKEIRELIQREVAQTKRTLLEYLIRVASGTEGAEVWRALFAELRQKLDA